MSNILEQSSVGEPPPGRRAPTTRVAVKRHPERGAYDFDTVAAILDAGIVCHIAFVVDGDPYALPMTYARMGDSLFVHGAVGSRLLRSLGSGTPVCLTVTLLDGLVLARSAFNHSMNYRSVVVFDAPAEVVDPEDKTLALRAILERLVPGRWEEIRPPTQGELARTTVLRIRLREASAKVRSGPPIDADADMDRAVWAGELPFQLAALTPVADPAAATAVPLPPYLEVARGTALPFTGFPV